MAIAPGPAPEKTKKAFFTHTSPTDSRQPARLSPTTRYLCGAAYRSEEFADQVIAELVQDGHRAVVPSVGYDLGPVLRHCFRARNLLLVQNLVITAILVIGLFVLTGPTVGLVLLALVAGGAAKLGKPSDWTVWHFLAAGGLLVLLWLSGFVPAVLALFDTETDPVKLEETPGSSSALRPLLSLLLLALGVFGTVYATRIAVLRTLTRELAPDRVAPAPGLDKVLVRERVETVTNAQHGNIVLHSGYDPFLGAGRIIHAWSLAMELKRDPDPGQPSAVDPDDRVAVDPVELNRHVKHCLAALASVDLPPHERLTGLALRDQIIATGARWRDYPLIDQRRRLPYAFATPQAIEAIIRAPQTSARHFLRASVGAENREVTGGSGPTIMPAEYQNIVVSTFVHIAVEGGMLYVENVSTVLGPLRQEFLDIDQYSAGDEGGLEPILQGLREFGGTTLLAPFRVGRTIARAITANRNMTRADRDSNRLPVYDFGARAEIRQIASSPRPVTYLQRLDAEKYSKLMERRINEAVIGFLSAMGIDISEYETRMNVFNNHGVFIRGDNHGPAAAGPGATALLNQVKDLRRKAGGSAAGSD